MNQELEHPLDRAIVAPPLAPHRALWSAGSRMLAGNVVYAVCQGGWLILISKLTSDASRGRFVLANAIVSTVVAFASFGLRGMLATDVKREHRFAAYLVLRLLSVCVALAVIFCIALTQPLDAGMVIVAVGFAKSIELISDLLWGRMQQFERFDGIAVSFVLKGIASLALLAIGLYFTRDSLGGACGIALGFLVSLLLWDLPYVRRLSAQESDAALPGSGKSPALPWRTRVGEMWEFVQAAAPLAFASSLVIFNGNIVIYFMRWHYGAEVAEPLIGVFGAFNYLIQIGTIVVTAIGVATATRLAQYYGEGNTLAFYRLLRRLIGLCLIIGIAGVVFSLVAGKAIISLLFKPEDMQHLSLLVWLVVSGGISYIASILGFAVTATRRFHRFTLPYLAVTVVGVVSSFLLIPAFGLMGAAWANAVMYLACCIAPAFILLRLHFEEP